MEQFTNLANSTLTAAIGTGDTTFNVVSATAFPTVGNFRIIVESEIMLVTAVAGTQFTVTRAQEGTSAAAHAASTVVTHTVTAGALAQFKLDANGWQTAVDVNFITQANQTFATDGSYTVGGLSWTKVNSSGDATAMAIVNGTGLVVQPASATDLGGATDTGPTLELPFSNAITGYSSDMPLRIWAYIASQNFAANFDGATVNFGNRTSKTFFLAVPGFSTAISPNLNVYIAFNFNSTGLSFTNIGPLPNVIMLEAPNGIDGGKFLVYSGTWSSGWPARSALSPLALQEPWSGTSTVLTNITPFGTASQWAMRLGAHRAGSGTALNVAFGQARIDFKG